MKIRTGFVSNSSSSSFICDVTGRVESGWDISLEEAEMYSCERGHTFDESFLVNEEGLGLSNIKKDIAYREIDKTNSSVDWYEKKRLRQEFYDNIKGMSEEELTESFRDLTQYNTKGDVGDVPAEHCPICTMKHIMDEDLLKYVLKTYKVSKAGVTKDIQSSFDTYDSFTEFIKY